MWQLNHIRVARPRAAQRSITRLRIPDERRHEYTRQAVGSQNPEPAHKIVHNLRNPKHKTQFRPANFGEKRLKSAGQSGVRALPNPPQEIRLKNDGLQGKLPWLLNRTEA